MPLTQENPGKKVFYRETEFQPGGSRRENIAEAARIKYLRTALQLVGVTFIFGIYTFTLLISEFAKPASSIVMQQRWVEGDRAYILWSAGSRRWRKS